MELLGQRIKLKEPYKPEPEVYQYGRDWPGFQYGVIVQIVSHEYDRQLRQERVKNISAHLFDREGRLYLCGHRQEKTELIPVPGFVDFHIDEFLLLTDNMV